MDKYKAAEALKKEGYDVSCHNGVIMVYYNPGMFENVREAIAERLEKMDYHSSWGLTAKKDKKESKPVQETAEVVQS